MFLHEPSAFIARRRPIQEGRILLQKAILTESGFDGAFLIAVSGILTFLIRAAFSFLMVENSTRLFSFTAAAIGEKQEWAKLVSSCISEIKETQTGTRKIPS